MRRCYGSRKLGQRETDLTAAMTELATESIGSGGDAPEPFSLRGWLRDLYFGSDLAATRFQLGLLVFDLVTVTFFLVANVLPY